MGANEEEGFDRKAEVERLLEQDETVLGLFWRYEQEGLTPQEMQEAEGTESVGWVYTYRSIVRVLREGYMPTAPSQALQGARRISSWLKSSDLSPELREALAAQESLLRSRAADPEAQAEEVGNAVKKTRDAEATLEPGVYVYTLPHYLRHPFEPDTGRTLLKVGHSANDAVYRVKAQSRHTSLPEDPILLRVYKTDESAQSEKVFHDWLRAADHPSNRNRRGGSEWFVTSTKFLDHIARSMGLAATIVNEFEVGDE